MHSIKLNVVVAKRSDVNGIMFSSMKLFSFSIDTRAKQFACQSPSRFGADGPYLAVVYIAGVGRGRRRQAKF